MKSTYFFIEDDMYPNKHEQRVITNMYITDKCPNCDTPTLYLASTTNNLKYICSYCDQRFTERAVKVANQVSEDKK